MAILTKRPAARVAAAGVEQRRLRIHGPRRGIRRLRTARESRAAVTAANGARTASRVSIHGRSYPDGTGLHNVHRNNGGHDGCILMRRNGVGGTDHVIALKFSGDVF